MALEQEGSNDSDLIQDLKGVLKTRDSREINNGLDLDKLLDRLSKVQKTGTAAAEIATKLFNALNGI